MKKIITQLTYDHTLSKKESKSSNAPSRTIPNQALTVQEILKRHSRNMPVDVAMNTPIYDSEELPMEYRLLDMRRMDLSEIDSVKESLTMYTAELQKQVEENNVKIKAAEAEAARRALKAEVAEELKQEASDKYPKKTPPEAS